jgi:hypothetical protein
MRRWTLTDKPNTAPFLTNFGQGFALAFFYEQPIGMRMAQGHLENIHSIFTKKQ